jgi:GTP cyclohydrolase II
MTPADKKLINIDRAINEMRRGLAVNLQTDLGQATILPAEYLLSADFTPTDMATPASNAPLPQVHGLHPTRLFVTGRRAVVLGLLELCSEGTPPKAVEILADGGLTQALIQWVTDPLQSAVHAADAKNTILDGVSAKPVHPAGPYAAAVQLAKVGRLLPAVVAVEITPAGIPPIATVDGDDIALFQSLQARTLQKVGAARVPLVGAENTEVVAFRPADGGVEHIAIVINTPDTSKPVLIRMHSECFTGDLLGSLRCDCGDQLRSAILEIAENGGGILLYLAQEGRGIGLVNKLRAYQIQDNGFDTLDANEQLGYDDDERVYIPAAEMLRQLGCDHVRLLTNNPNKINALGRHGITVTERVPHIVPPNDHNRFYLYTKAQRSGHLF